MEVIVLWSLVFMVVIVITVTSVFLLSVAVYITYIRSKYRHLPSPPYNSFFLGHGLELASINRKGSFQGELLLRWAEELGPIFVIFILHKSLIIVTGTSSIKEVLTQSKYPKAPDLYLPIHSLFGARFLGFGLVTETDHYLWHKRRAVINPAFNKKYLTLFLEQFNDVADRWIESLGNAADSKTVFDMHAHMGRVTSDAIAEVGFHDQRSSIDTKDDQFLNAIFDCLKAITPSTTDLAVKFSPTKRMYRQSVRDSVNLIRHYGQNLLNKRLELIKRGKTVPQDILSFIIKAKEVDPSISDEVLLDDFVTLFMAGQETTANALSFLFSEVGRNPEVLQRLYKMQDEIDHVMGSRNDLEYEDLGKLEYCDQVFKEVLRLYPVAPGTGRKTVENVILDGHEIPSGSTMLFPFYPIQRSSQYYENPHEFCPDRFAPDKQRTLYAYMPFSLGQRSCAGQQFAQIESKVLICKFFKCFEFKLDPNQSFVVEESGTLRPKEGVMMTLFYRR